jgi:carboxylesterase
VLLLHGFAGSPDSVRVLVAPLTALGVPLALPTLPGHGAASPEALRGVVWPAWMAAANAALEELCTRAERVIVVGNSMGGLIALQLAADHPTLIDSVVLASAPIQLASPLAPGGALAPLTPLILAVLPRWPLRKRYADPALAAGDTSYVWAPIGAIATLLDFIRHTRTRLAAVHAPVLILQGRHDPVVAPASVAILLRELGSPAEQRQVVWFERSLHELFRDGEREAAAACVAGFVQQRLAWLRPSA